jgi:hypothetical protein
MSIHVGDVGTAIEFTVTDQDGAALDLSAYDALTILVTRPDGTTLQKAATPSGDGTDGRMRYVTAADDLNDPGTYRFQGVVDLASGLWHTDVVKARVLANLA